MSHSLGAQFAPAVLASAAEHSRQARTRAENFSDPDYSADHSAHGANPIFHSTGWHNANQPCGYSTCKNHDEAFSEHVYDRELSPGTVQKINPRTAPLVANEPMVDLNAVQRYAKEDPGKGPPKVVEHKGMLHIVDGHHRLLAAHLTGRDIDIEVSK
jgi:hypothetical protein